MKRKRIISFIAMILVVLFIPTIINAEEIAQEVGKSIKLRWSYVENSKYTLLVNNGLSSSYGHYSGVNNAITRLNNQSPSFIQVKSSSFSNSKVDIMVPASSSWNTLASDANAIATTIPKSTSGTFYYSYNDLPSSGTININYAMIWYNPEEVSTTATGRTGTAMHELMHCYGMGHPINYYNSMMNPTYAQLNTTLTAYDLAEFSRMY